MALLRPISCLLRSNLRNIKPKYCARSLTTEISDEKPAETKPGGYAQAFEKFESLKDTKSKAVPQTFASLLRNSKFIDVGVKIFKLIRF